MFVCLWQVLVPLIAYVGAPASGAHFNPIVTFSFMATGIMVWLTDPDYLGPFCMTRV